jgi:cysteine sulfinate desulfinase/cysteine desulfurase-like protein
MERVYFDYNATTPLAPEVAAAMRPFLEQEYGNPSSLHWAGERARVAIDRARSQVAALLHCEPAEIIFHVRRHRVQQLGAGRRLLQIPGKDPAAFYH